MRTFPKALATFRIIVEERGNRLRQLSYKELKELAHETEYITVDSRPATIDNIVLPLPNGGLQVVVQGFMEGRLLPGKSVALDGFFKNLDETISPMPDEEFHKFD